jgi:hypothetical protein
MSKGRRTVTRSTQLKAGEWTRPRGHRDEPGCATRQTERLRGAPGAPLSEGLGRQGAHARGGRSKVGCGRKANSPSGRHVGATASASDRRSAARASAVDGFGPSNTSQLRRKPRLVVRAASEQKPCPCPASPAAEPTSQPASGRVSLDPHALCPRCRALDASDSLLPPGRRGRQSSARGGLA